MRKSLIVSIIILIISIIGSVTWYMGKINENKMGTLYQGTPLPIRNNIPVGEVVKRKDGFVIQCRDGKSYEITDMEQRKKLDMVMKGKLPCNELSN